MAVNRRDSASHRHPQGLLLLRNHVPRDRFPLLIAPPYTTYTHTFMEIAKLKHFRCLTISRKISQTINGKVHTGQSVNNFIILTNLLGKPIDNFSSSSPSYRKKNWLERTIYKGFVTLSKGCAGFRKIVKGGGQKYNLANQGGIGNLQTYHKNIKL